MLIKIKKLHKDAVLPKYAHGPEDDSGMDLCSVEDITLVPGAPTIVKTGLSIELPPYFEAQIRPRSGLAFKHGIQVVNSPGTVDPSYRGEIGVILLWSGVNSNDEYSGLFQIKTGDRIAQMVVARYEPISWYEADDLSSTARGTGGYGSTGVKECITHVK